MLKHLLVGWLAGYWVYKYTTDLVAQYRILGADSEGTDLECEEAAGHSFVCHGANGIGELVDLALQRRFVLDQRRHERVDTVAEIFYVPMGGQLDEPRRSDMTTLTSSRVELVHEIYEYLRFPIVGNCLERLVQCTLRVYDLVAQIRKLSYILRCCIVFFPKHSLL